MARFVKILVTPIYHCDSGRTRCMPSEIFHLHVPLRLSKRYMADNGRILRSLRYFSRFNGFSKHLLGKILFRITITEKSNNHSYSTSFTI